MKNPKKLFKNVVTGVVATGTVIGTVAGGIVSCTDALYSNEQDVGLPDEGISAINLDLSKEDMKYLVFLDKLGNDIIKNPIIAEEFAKNPQLYVERYGYSEKIDIEENMLKLILALGNEDINAAINANDIKRAIELMKDKGLLDSNSYSKILISEEKKNEILASLGVDEAQFDEYGVCSVAVVCFAAGVIMVAAAVGVAGSVVYSIYVYNSVEYWGQRTNMDNSKFIDNNPAFKVWNLKNDPGKTFVAVDLYLEEEVDKIIEGLEYVNKDIFDKIPKLQFREILKLNILNQNRYQ